MVPKQKLIVSPSVPTCLGAAECYGKRQGLLLILSAIYGRFVFALVTKERPNASILNQTILSPVNVLAGTVQAASPSTWFIVRCPWLTVRLQYLMFLPWQPVPSILEPAVPKNWQKEHIAEMSEAINLLFHALRVPKASKGHYSCPPSFIFLRSTHGLVLRKRTMSAD